MRSSTLNSVVGADPAGGRGRESLAGVLVGDSEDFDRPSVSRLVEKEVERPNVVRAGRGHVARHPLASPTLTRSRWQAQPLVSPQPLHAFAVAAKAVPAQQRVDAPVAVAGMTPGQQPQPLPQQQLVRDGPAAVALRGATLAGCLAGSSLQDPEAMLQVHDRPAPPLRGQKFPRDTSLSMSISRECSPTIRFSRALSFSNCFNRTTSSGRIASYCDRHR